MLNRFFEGRTSHGEEQTLYRFFDKKDIPDHLLRYKTVFKYFGTSMAEEPTALPVAENRRTPRMPIKHWLRWASLAAAIATGCIFLFHQWKADTFELYEGSCIIRRGVRITDTNLIRSELEKTFRETLKQETDMENWINKQMESDDLFEQYRRTLEQQQNAFISGFTDPYAREEVKRILTAEYIKMKTKIKLLFGLTWLLGIFSIEASAQDAIKALIKKCESMETVDINIVRTRDRNTKEVRSITTLQIESNPALVKEFQDTFQKTYDADFSKNKDAADQEIITRRGGKIVTLMYKYDNITYRFSVKDDGNSAEVSVWEGRSGKNQNSVNFDNLHFSEDLLGNFSDNFEWKNFGRLHNHDYSGLLFRIPDLYLKSFEYF